MTRNNFESGERVEKKELESTPQESDVMSRYIDLRARTYDVLMSDDERKNFSQDLIDTVKILNQGTDIDPEVRGDLLKQIKVLEEDYMRIKLAVDAVKRLKHESRGGVQVPHTYKKAVSLINEAIRQGVPDNTFDPFQEAIRDYLRMTQSR